MSGSELISIEIFFLQKCRMQDNHSKTYHLHEMEHFLDKERSISFQNMES